MDAAAATFPLRPRLRVRGAPGGLARSRRRDRGGDLIGSRPYRPGDRLIDIAWASSARLSAAAARPELVVHERLGEDVPPVVVGVEPLPAPDPAAAVATLDKAATAASAVALIAASARAAGGRLHAREDAGGAGALDRLLQGFAERRREAPPGSVVFVVSDFLGPPQLESWEDALAADLDPVAVIVQDPVWERSFPAVAGLGLPLRERRGGPLRLVRLTAAECEALRQAHEQRFAALLDDLDRLGVDAVVLDASEPDAVLEAFCGFADARAGVGGRL